MARVPTVLTPKTAVDTGQRGYVQNVRTPDNSFMASALAEMSAFLEQEKRQKEQFEIRKTATEAANLYQYTMNDYQQNAQLGAPGFMEQWTTFEQANRETMLEQFREKGYSDEGVQELELILQSQAVQHLGQAFNFKRQQNNALTLSEAESLGISTSQYAANNPDDVVSALENFREGVDSLPGDAETKDRIYRSFEPGAVMAAGKGLITQGRARDIVSVLDPDWLVRQSVGTTSGGTFSGFQGVAQSVAEHTGLTPEEVAAVFSFETGGKFDPNLFGGDKKRYLGLIQFGPYEQELYGIKPGASPEEWSNAIKRFLDDRGFEKGMSLEDFYSTILTGRPGNYDVQDSNGTNVRNGVSRIRAEHLESAKRWLNQGLVAPSPEAVIPVDPDAAIEVPSIPALALMDGNQQQQLLGWAKSALQEEITSSNAQFDVAHNNAVAELEVRGETATPIGTIEQYKARYGPVWEQKWAEVETAKEVGQARLQMQGMSLAEMNATLAAIEPAPGSPTYEVELAAYAKAAKARDDILDARDKDAAAYVFSVYPNLARNLEGAQGSAGRKAAYEAMERTYEKLGIPENKRQYMTRGMINEAHSQYIQASNSEKFSLISSWIEEMGADRAGYTLGLMGDDVVRDVQLYATLAPTPNFQRTFTQVQEGREIIKEDPARKPDFQLINTQFVKGLETAINNLDGKVSARFNEAAAALYVRRGGRTENRALTDKNLYEAALREVFGGSADDENTGPVDLTSGKRGIDDFTILPPTVTKKQFTNWLETRTNADFVRLSTTGRAPADRFGNPIAAQDIIDHGVFVMIYPGMYRIKMAGDGKELGDTQGRPYRIRLRPRDIR